MALSITNLNAIFAANQINQHNTLLSRSLERLSSGYRINRSSDDPGGQAIADRMRIQARGWQQASRNIGLATNMVHTVEEAVTNIVDIMMDIRDLAMESASGTLSDSDRAVNQAEVDQLINEIDRLATAVKFNGIRLLNGTFSSIRPSGSLLGGGTYQGSLYFQVGADSGSNFRAYFATTSTAGIGLSALSVSSRTSASTAVSLLDSSIGGVMSFRARVGGYARRLQITQNFADFQSDNYLSAESVVRDADIAVELVNFSKHQILLQAASAMLAQANLNAQSTIQALFNFNAG